MEESLRMLIGKKKKEKTQTALYHGTAKKIRLEENDCI